MKTNSELRAAARSQLKGTWLAAVGVVLVYSLIVSAMLGIGLLILGGPLCFGLLGYFSRKARGETAAFGNLFDGFDDGFGRSFFLYLFEGIFIFLWSLLLCIPGLIKTLSYSMSFFILRDNPGMKPLDAITASRRMMNGHKWQLFCLGLNFIGWALLCVLTFGIGYLWLCPYVILSMANFYEDLKQQPSQQQNTLELPQF
ncbi:MAG: DUF975 family protein [Treponema sp.]|jgi:uncharacterized membrane protein|nr:DUF975 family protein [Treponema sp.]